MCVEGNLGAIALAAVIVGTVPVLQINLLNLVYFASLASLLLLIDLLPQLLDQAGHICSFLTKLAHFFLQLTL